MSAEKIFIEKKSGADFAHRMEFLKALDFVREEDYFMVEVINRLGWDYEKILKIVSQLKKRKVVLLATSAPLQSETLDDLLLDCFVKDLILQLFAMITEKE
ncbi:recombinase family protein [Listeria fleischmannii]|uniref:Site-specific recombinase n=1 Tax=Listeria fleischmannii FSL S10-1203 TaxID=1265822 RepID=W7D7V6_9LIST|nr:recombinase family protein [Listeria fleischmannii]EUJ48361.1 site-specific recombinase [Listeria fleischmannii FSL S10-1203]